MAFPQVVLIDGPSGSGKTTLARQLAIKSGKQLIHMDDVYPGWSGLQDGIEIIAHSVFGATKPQFYRWDWEHDCFGQVCQVDTSQLIIEGVGALAPEIVMATKGKAAGVLLQMPELLRKQRALNRDPSFASHWDMWAQQERVHFAKLDQIVNQLPLLKVEATDLCRGESVKIVAQWLWEKLRT